MIGRPSSSRTRTGRWRLTMLASVVAAGIALVLGVAGSASAHDDIESSTPANRSTIDDPISSVTIDFGSEISDDVQMFLVYDRGDGEFDDLGGDTVRTDETTARLDFPEIESEGTYFVRYLAPVPTDGHVIEGAMSFTWGQPSGSDPGFPILAFVGVAMVILAVGAWFTYRRMLVPVDDEHREPLVSSTDADPL